MELKKQNKRIYDLAERTKSFAKKVREYVKYLPKTISGIETIVLKPTILGGIEKIRHMIKEAKKAAIKTVISSSFETSIGIKTLSNIAATIGHGSPAGLDTIKLFKHDVVNRPLLPKKGALPVDNTKNQSRNLNFKFLHQVL